MSNAPKSTKSVSRTMFRSPFRAYRKMPSDVFRDTVLDLLGRGYGVRFRATGRSMHPTVNEGEIITVMPVEASAVRKNDIILYRAHGGLVAHRVVGIEESGAASCRFVMQGDASLDHDAPVRAEQVLGRVVSTERNGRSIALAGPRARMLRRLRVRASGLKRWLHAKVIPIRRG